MPTPRASTTPRRTGDSRAAVTQLRTADQSARVAKDARAKAKGTKLTVPLVHKDKAGNEVARQEFSLSEDVGIMPLMEWAAASDRDVASADGLRAVFYVLEDAVHEDEWAEFRKWARENKVDAGELLDFANSALEALAGRPTGDATGS
jgi:hypothetical protein